MILGNCLVPNIKQPYGMSNGWKLYLPYSEKMMSMIREEKVLSQGVEISFITKLQVKHKGHLLWNIASDDETNIIINKYRYVREDPFFKMNERRPSLRSFENLLIDSGCTTEESKTLRQSVRKVSSILFIKLWGPHLPIERKIDGVTIVDKSYQIDTKYKSSLMSYILPTNNNIISLNDIIKRRSFQLKLPMSNPLLCWCRNVLDKLFQSNIDTIDGISVVTEEPMGNGLMMNINRNGVLQQYYGMNIGESKDNLINRATYLSLIHI